MEKINTRAALNWLAFVCLVFMILVALGDAGLNLAAQSSHKAAWPFFVPTLVFCMGAALCFVRAVAKPKVDTTDGNADASVQTSNGTRKLRKTIVVASLLWATGSVLLSIAGRCTADHGEFCGHDLRGFRRAYGSYIATHVDTFPPMSSPSVFVAAVAHEPYFAKKPLAEVEASFSAPDRGEPCHVNSWLDGKTFQDVPQPSHFVALYGDVFPMLDVRFPVVRRNMFRAVIYADGRESVIREAQWPELKQLSHIP